MTTSYSVSGITFTSAAPAYTINPGTMGTNGFTLAGGITNNGTNLQTINDPFTTTAVRTVTMTPGGGNIVLGGNISGSGGGLTTAGTGTLTLSGSNNFTGALTVAGSTQVVLSGNNVSRPAATSSLTVVNSGGTLQLQANSLNTTSGTSYALSAEVTANQPLTLNSGSMLLLRSDSSVTFAGGNNLGGLGAATVGIDVNQLTGAGSGQTLTLAPAGFATSGTTINVTGGNGYSLALGPITNGYSAALTLNTTANTSLGSDCQHGVVAHQGRSRNAHASR